jgi:hypothetical protein
VAGIESALARDWTSDGATNPEKVLEVLAAAVGPATGSEPDAVLGGVEPEPGSGVDPLPLLGPDGDDGEDELSDPANCTVADAVGASTASRPSESRIDTARVVETPNVDLMGAH